MCQCQLPFQELNFKDTERVFLQIILDQVWEIYRLNHVLLSVQQFHHDVACGHVCGHIASLREWEP